MPIIHRVAKALGYTRSSETAGTAGMLPGIIPPPRSRAGGAVSPDTAAGLSTVYRAFQILGTAASQISFHSERGGLKLDPAAVPSLIKRPCLSMDNSTFVEQTVLHLAATGNAYWLKNTGPSGEVLDLDLINPHEVAVNLDPRDGKKRFGYRGKSYTTAEMMHLHLLMLPGRLTGLGPIQAAQIEIRGALDLRDYSSQWFSEGSVPPGVLTSEQVITADDAKQYKAAWKAATADPHDIPVFGKGTTFTPSLLKPADAQWLENQQFTTTQLARLFGTPASLMLAAVEGSAMTYSNVEQDWIAFTRFTLMGYLRKIENALTELSPRGQEVRFNVDALLRTDTKTRYEAHALAITNGFLTVDEVRAIEGWPPLPNGAGAVTGRAAAQRFALSLTEGTP